MSQKLLVLGAGPKALALAAKAAVLRMLDVENVPDVIAIDRRYVAANWDGANGFTDGLQLLGTPPEKDVGFPYRSSVWVQGRDLNREVNDKMLAYSWYRYKVLEDRQEPYSTWIDRGLPQPTHGEWGAYLKWVAAEARLNVKTGEVIRIDLSEAPLGWRVICETEDGVEEVRGDGLVISGPGASPSRTQPERCFDPISFWNSLDKSFSGSRGLDICVVGAGETAAAAVAALLSCLGEACRIFVVSPHSFIYSRGESFLENRVFTDPGTWDEVSAKDRDEFIRRTDRSVFSQAVQEKINLSHIEVKCLPGRVDLTAVKQSAKGVQISVLYDNQKPRKYEFDYVLDAASLNRLWFLDLLSAEARQRLEQVLHDLAVDEGLHFTSEELLSRKMLETRIDFSLRVRSFKPSLHLPMLSALRRGPGFPNLSCLGLLSDRILKYYVDGS